MKNNIYQKLKSACEKSDIVEKAEKKRGMIYNPLLHDAVSEVAMKTLIKNNLYCYCTYEDTKIGENFVGITCNMIVVDIDNTDSKIEIKTSAIDKKDRYGLGGAMSYSRKYAFLSLLNLATGIKDDKEEVQDSETGFAAEPLYNNSKKTNQPTSQKIDDTYIVTEIARIEELIGKENSKSLRSDLENLKTRIYKANKWDNFVKSDGFKKYNLLVEKTKPNKQRS